MRLEAGRLYTIVCIAVGDRVNLSGELENHLRGLDLNTIFLPDSERDAGNDQKGRQATYLLQTEGAEGGEQKNSLRLDQNQ